MCLLHLMAWGLLAIAILWSPEEKGKEHVGGKEMKIGTGRALSGQLAVLGKRDGLS